MKQSYKSTLVGSCIGVLTLCTLAYADPPEVLQKRDDVQGASWNNLDFEDITNRPSTLAGYGILDAQPIYDVAIVKTFVWGGDAWEFTTDETATIFWPNAGMIRGMECDVLTAPHGGDITLDLLAGNPLASVYPENGQPKIMNDETSTLDHLPEALEDMVPIAKRDLLQLKIVSAPAHNYSSAVETIGDLPSTPQIGTYLLVLSDGHVWLGRDYGYAYTDLGLAPGLTGAAATTGALPTGQAAGIKYLVDADDHVYTSNGNDTWTDSGTLSESGIWGGNTIASVANLNYATPPGSTFLTLNTGKLWRNDYALWTDQGLAHTSGKGLRCNVYIYNLPNED